MVPLSALWLPIVLSAVAVFMASAVIHMVIKYHNSDYSKLPGEDNIRAAIRAEGVPPGYYTMPHCTDMKEMANPDVQAKFKEGPVGFVTLIPNGLPSMGKSLTAWFILCLVIGVFVAYLAGLCLGPGAEYLAVFQIVGTAALLGYAGCEATDSIWKGMPWKVTAKHMFDGLLYALITAGVFGWLWPS